MSEFCFSNVVKIDDVKQSEGMIAGKLAILRQVVGEPAVLTLFAGPTDQRHLKQIVIEHNMPEPPGKFPEVEKIVCLALFSGEYQV